jgi:hypothetical protein
MSPIIRTNNHPPQATKSLAIPTPGSRPRFEHVAAIALMAAEICGQSVCVLCLTQETLQKWICRLEKDSAQVTLLDVLNTNRATLADWKTLLRQQAYDVTILHGVHHELQADRLSVGYVKELVDAVPSGLVVVA